MTIAAAVASASPLSGHLGLCWQFMPLTSVSSAPLPGTTSDGDGRNDGADTERVTEQPLPDKGDKDDDSAWGDPPTSDTADDDEERLERERPPHYDR